MKSMFSKSSATTAAVASDASPNRRYYYAAAAFVVLLIVLYFFGFLGDGWLSLESVRCAAIALRWNERHRFGSDR